MLTASRLVAASTPNPRLAAHRPIARAVRPNGRTSRPNIRRRAAAHPARKLADAGERAGGIARRKRRGDRHAGKGSGREIAGLIDGEERRGGKSRVAKRRANGAQIIRIAAVGAVLVFKCTAIIGPPLMRCSVASSSPKRRSQRRAGARNASSVVRTRIASSRSSHAGRPPKSHSAQTYGPGRRMTSSPSSCAART